MRRRVLASLTILVLALGTVGVAPAAAVEYEFPPGNTGFHTYWEMVAEVEAAAAAHPTIVQRRSIGKSHIGRDIWAVKVSDHVANDEPEPEVLFDGLHHGNEHMSQEMTLAILKWLTTGYGHDTRVTNLVNSREVWIIFGLNPDGATYDIKGRTYHDWRKNLQPTPGSSSVGTDLNRNYDYRWGCCGGSSSNPASWRYRGPSRFSAPETRAFRDFVISRVVGGRQQIRTAISFHTTGRLDSVPVWLHTRRRPVRHQRDRSPHVRRDGQGDGCHERLQARTGERSLHLVGHVAGLAVRTVPDLLVHLRDVAELCCVPAR